MKKVLSVFVIAGMVALIACGPSAEEKAAKEKAKADSIAAVLKADSIAMAEKEKAVADSVAAAALKFKQDSIAAAEANKKGGAKKVVKAGTGKG
jgi:hypothetical protein